MKILRSKKKEQEFSLDDPQVRKALTGFSRDKLLSLGFYEDPVYREFKTMNELLLDTRIDIEKLRNQILIHADILDTKDKLEKAKIERKRPKIGR